MNTPSSPARLHPRPPFRFVSFQAVARCCLLGGLMLFLTACDSTTVLLANFNSDSVGSQPGATQNTGTVSLELGTGSITVIDTPAPGVPANNWVRINHPNAADTPTGIRSVFSRFDGLGDYGLLASLYIPSGTGVVSVQFEPFIEPNEDFNFMHIDFMPEGDVRVDDGPIRFGHFPRNEPFVLSAHLKVTSTTAVAEFTLLGKDASGSTSVSVQPILLSAARQFGAVRFGMGFPHQGSFFVDDILVTRSNKGP